MTLAFTQVGRGFIKFAQIFELKYSKTALESTAVPRDFHHIFSPVL